MPRLALITLSVLLAGTSAIAQDAAIPAGAAASRDIIVTGRSLRDTADALAACLARSCPPDQDIAATLAHAENQFIAGDYRDARGTMLASIRRNQGEARGYAVPLSDLYRANARVAAHLGESRAYQLSVLDMRDTLAAGLPATDPRLLAARIEVADSRMRLGYPDEARRAYSDIAADALRMGHPRVAAFARIRLALADLPNLRGSAAERDTARVRGAIATLTEVAGQPEVSGADMALLADVLLARVERESGDMTRTDALMARFVAGNGAQRPLLVSGEPVRINDGPRQELGGESNVLARMQSTNVERRWVDVGFWINADGRVDDFEILRHDGDTRWARAVETSVKSRVYTPLRSENGSASPGFYIIERYTLTATLRDDCTGSRLRCRDPQLTVERIDLTPDDVTNTPSRTS